MRTARRTERRTDRAAPTAFLSSAFGVLKISALDRELAATLKRLETLHPVAQAPGLDRIERLLNMLGNPHRRLPPVIHIAGTNGKGSVAAMLDAVASASGLVSHVYTSPHLIRFAERIRVAGKQIEEEALLALLHRVETINAAEPATFFEITTAAAFLAFAESSADLVILETGLGGRFDATNVVPNPACAVITSVAVDHTEFLGGDVSAIAWEKAGILKPGAPAVVGVQEPEARAAIAAEALRLGVETAYWGRDFSAREENGRLIFEDGSRVIDLPRPKLAGGHQIANAGVAVAAALEVFDPDEQALGDGLTSAIWPARLEQAPPGPLFDRIFAPAGDDAERLGEIWIDGAHNVAGAAALAHALADLEDRAPRPVILLLGILKTKDARGMISQFAGLAHQLIATPITSAAGAAPDDLTAIAEDCGIPAIAAASIEDALGLAAQTAQEVETAPRVVIAGSLYLAGEALALNEGRTRTATAG
ncbi:MAG: folylpolyglutamate synthase/dihydrofolate synthase family protein [Maricaulaceae bacterium]|jgi:dihydrofolate synthase/folylpolyglutamate synthase